VHSQRPPALLRRCMRHPRTLEPAGSPRRTETVIQRGTPALQRLAGYPIIAGTVFGRRRSPVPVSV
jgi:hypothetical protein